MTTKIPKFAVEIDNLSKSYRDKTKGSHKEAVKTFSLNIPRGSFFGLLGPNGAGKSTIINILAGLVIKDSGNVKVWGYDIKDEMRKARSSIGIVPQELNIDPFFSPREILEVQAGLYGVPRKMRRTNDILKAVHLLDKADAYARTLSGGMRRRLLVAKAMVHSPPVLVLDEPTAGVDEELRQQLWKYIRELRDMGTTIMLTTHYLEEAEELCDEIAIINKGELVACKPTEELLQTLESKELVVSVDAELKQLPTRLKKLNAELNASNKLIFKVPPGQSSIENVLNALRMENLTIRDLHTKESDLEDIFLLLTKEPIKP
ncbi:MAG: ABC transporter ATP-binding protein [Pseudomonadota bacterium]|nr:ABC transporter ATP-binding protein [Pseudomonadota bacterium]